MLAYLCICACGSALYSQSERYTVGRARGRIYLWRIVRVAAALSPYQETREGGYRPRTQKRQNARHEGRRRKRQNGGGRERAAEVATSPRKSRVMPTRNCTTPRTPLPTLSLLARSIRSIPFPLRPTIPLYLSFRLLLAFPAPPLPFYAAIPSLFPRYLRCHYSLRRTTTTTTTFYRLRISPISGE